jgi:DedD protein
MAFFKFRQRNPSQGEPASRADEPAAEPRETIDGLRRRARHRLLGALALVLAAVIGFPLLFDTQPRPVVVDAPIIIPDRDRAPPLRLPQAASAPALTPAPAPIPTPAPGDRVSAEASLTAGEELVPDAAPPASAAASATRPAASAATRPAAQAATRSSAPAATAAASAARPVASAPSRREETADPAARARRQAEAEARARREADSARALALLEGKKPPPAPAAAPAVPAVRAPAPPASSAAAGGRFVVQIGAFADAAKARQARQQAERAGLKTYVQDVTARDGKRTTRVRVGPYASRAEAERAAAALQKAGLTGAILSL